jgi:hypothetical protein
MRCHICNAINAEHHDKRDDVWICTPCKEDVDQIIYEQELEDEELDEDAPDLPELYT